jgi:hypothetical protein
VVEHALDKAGRLGARQTEPAVNDVGKVRARQRSVGVRVIIDPRDPKIRHGLSPASAGVPPAVQYRFVTKTYHIGNRTFDELPRFINT